MLRKSLWGFRENRIHVRFQREWHDSSGQWYRSYGNELWEFDDDGLMRRREASINDVAITEAEIMVRFHRPAHLPIVLASGLIDKPVPVPWWNDRPLRLVQ